jgi:pilus assembly protein CpaF
LGIWRMRSSHFGRRVVEARSTAVVLVSDRSDDLGPLADLVVNDQHKAQIHAGVMARIDPSAASRVPRERLLEEVAKLVGEIATAERIQLNELEENQLAAELTDDMIGLGPLEPLLEDDEVTDILVNGPFEIYVERFGRLEQANVRFRNAQHVLNVAQRIASGVGRRIDEASPMVDARLADGSRVNIVLPPLVLNGGSISIRKFPGRGLSLEEMAAQHNLSPEMARFLELAAQIRANILISGGTGSGKTTLLNAMSRHIDPAERVITIEDAVELQLQQPHVVQMETRAANIEGVGEVAQRELLRNALRMRPDRIIVGEVRGAEAFDMLQAMNTGHDGSMSTIHANAPRDALSRLESMVLMAANLPLRTIRSQIASAIHLIVQLDRMRDGIRRVVSIMEIAGMDGDVISTRELFSFIYRGDSRDATVKGAFQSSGMRPDLASRAAHFGLERQLLETIGPVGA